MKTCFKCDRRLPLDEFYRHPRMADGHLNKCKACTKGDVNARAEAKRADPDWIESERSRGREKYRRLYRPAEPQEFWVADVPWELKYHARNVLAGALRSGKVKKPSVCECCGGMGRISGHHEDYGAPLQVEWLCGKCHRDRHSRPSETRTLRVKSLLEDDDVSDVK